MAVLTVSLKKVCKYNNICFCNFQFLCGNMLYGRHSRNAMIYYLSAMVAEKLKTMPIILVLNLQKNYMDQNPDYYHYWLFAIAKCVATIIICKIQCWNPKSRKNCGDIHKYFYLSNKKYYRYRNLEGKIFRTRVEKKLHCKMTLKVS